MRGEQEERGESRVEGERERGEEERRNKRKICTDGKKMNVTKDSETKLFEH